MAWADILNDGSVIRLAGMLVAFLLILLLSIGGLSVAFVKALRSGGSTRKVRQLEAQEARAFQDLQRGFRRMEERIESLETLFMGRSQHRTYDRERELD
ncbi:MAG: hypothetical protein QGD90_07085 [Candidatus Hydrogenedentes bacterium]|nr:hypothetical protein [Candidatus Hydrogenedentota bacterium]